MLRQIGLLAVLAIAFGPESALVHDPDARIRTLNKLIVADPADARLLVRRGELHRQIGHLEKAFRDLDAARRLAPKLSEVHLVRALAFVDARRPRAALGAVDCFLAKHPKHSYATLTRARLLRTLGRGREAVRAFDRVVQLTSRPEPEHFLEQAMAHAAVGDRPGARASVQRGLDRLGPVVSLAQYGRGLGMRITARPPVKNAGLSSAAPKGALPPTTRIGEVTVVPMGATWKYLDDGSNQGTAWQALNFNDTSWKSGAAQLGYGDGDESTIVSYGNDPKLKHITTYFRRAFQIPAGVAIAQARLRLIRDDGVVVYLNGTEIARDNMPAGPIAHTTLASSQAFLYEETRIRPIAFNPALLRPGRNVVAVETHQVTVDSTDLTHALELRVSDGTLSLEREPYLQQIGPDRCVVRWRTDYPTATVAFLGPAANRLKAVVQSNQKVFEHTALLTGLTPDTVYYYAIGNNNGILAGDQTHRFKTAPKPGATKKTRIWAIGDSGTADANAAAVYGAYAKFTGKTPTDVWLMLGDNAYQTGTDAEYQRAVFDMYPELLRSTSVWPTIGNHDSYTSTASFQSGPYYDSFVLATQGEVGGVASGTESYYSFDHGDIHFVCLNSADSSRSTSGAMLTWLAADLAANQRKWTIAFWHHPPYSKGSHDTDNPNEVESHEIRANALPILEKGGVDLVLSGHSHSYERSFLLDGHYGRSSTLHPSMLKDVGNGRPTSHGAYTKPSLSGGAHEGAVYVVAGCSGLVSGGSLNHKAMVVSMSLLGSVVIDVDGSELVARFLTHQGKVEDTFTLRKGVKRTLYRDVATISLATGGSQTLNLDAGVAHATKAYMIAGSLGTKPGFRYTGVHVPLNYDAWFDATVTLRNTHRFQNTSGFLDFRGRSVARISIPPIASTSLVGTTLHHAFVVFDSSGARMASNPVSFTLVK